MQDFHPSDRNPFQRCRGENLNENARGMSVAMVEIQSLKLWPPLHLSVCFVTWRGGCLRHKNSGIQSTLIGDCGESFSFRRDRGSSHIHHTQFTTFIYTGWRLVVAAMDAVWYTFILCIALDQIVHSKAPYTFLPLCLYHHLYFLPNPPITEIIYIIQQPKKSTKVFIFIRQTPNSQHAIHQHRPLLQTKSLSEQWVREPRPRSKWRSGSEFGSRFRWHWSNGHSALNGTLWLESRWMAPLCAGGLEKELHKEPHRRGQWQEQSSEFLVSCLCHAPFVQLPKDKAIGDLYWQSMFKLILVWSPGKGSAIHDHANAHCVMKVLSYSP